MRKLYDDVIYDNIILKGEINVKRQDANKILLKIIFYFISLWLLFLLVSIITIDIDFSIGLKDNLRKNIVSLIALLLSIVSFSLRLFIKDKTKSTTNPGYKIIKIENKNYDFLTFLSTYIIPLVFIDFNNLKQIIVVVALLVFMGIVFAKMNLYLANPTLALFYNLYRIDVDTNNGNKTVTIISKDKLSVDDCIEWIPFDNGYWFVRRKNK